MSAKEDLEVEIAKVLWRNHTGYEPTHDQLHRSATGREVFQAARLITEAISTRKVLDTIVESVHYDGLSTDGLTVGELRRALA